MEIADWITWENSFISISSISEAPIFSIPGCGFAILIKISENQAKFRASENHSFATTQWRTARRSNLSFFGGPKFLLQPQLLLSQGTTEQISFTPLVSCMPKCRNQILTTWWHLKVISDPSSYHRTLLHSYYHHHQTWTYIRAGNINPCSFCHPGLFTD